MTFDITKHCIPLLRTGVYDETNCTKIGDIIREIYENQGVIFTDTKKILSSNGKLAGRDWMIGKPPQVKTRK